jgi:hypothetical protein
MILFINKYVVVVMVVRLQRGEIVVRLPQPGVAVGQERGCAVVLSEVVEQPKQ